MLTIPGCRPAHLGARLIVFGFVMAGSVVAGVAATQNGRSRTEIWDIALGTPAADIPRLEFQDYACGTNGGPPGLVLKDFAGFARCRPEPDGLHEVHFRYDDEIEYIALARGESSVAERLQGNKVFGTPAITSFLIDDAGIIRGLRVVTDPRASLHDRAEAYTYRHNFKARFGLDGWTCEEGTPDENKSPVGNAFVDERCEKTTPQVHLVVEAHYYRRRGEAAFDPITGEATPGQFESSARLEVYQVGRAVVRAPSSPKPDTPNAFLAGKARDCPGCDLRGVSLKRRDLSGADLSGADLSGASLHRAILSGAKLAGANLKNANLNKADLKMADLTGADLEGAMLYEADLGGASLDRAVLTSARLQHARLTQAKLPGAKLDTAFATGANFAGADLTGADLESSIFEGADFQRANLTGASLRGSGFVTARFIGADLSMTHADQTDFLEADFKDANLANAEWLNSRLTRAVTTGADMTNIRLSGSFLPDGSVAP